MDRIDELEEKLRVLAKQSDKIHSEMMILEEEQGNLKFERLVSTKTLSKIKWKFLIQPKMDKIVLESLEPLYKPEELFEMGDGWYHSTVKLDTATLTFSDGEAYLKFPDFKTYDEFRKKYNLYVDASHVFDEIEKTDKYLQTLRLIGKELIGE